MPINSKLRDRCSEALETGFEATVGASVVLDGSLSQPYVTQTFKEAYNTSAGGSETGLPVFFSDNFVWQTGYVTFNHNANTLTVESISDSSANGVAVDLNGSATVSVSLLSDIPLELPPVVVPDPGYLGPFTTAKKNIFAYLNRIETVPDWVTCIDCMFMDVKTSDSVSPRLTLGYGSSTYQRFGYNSGGRDLTTTGTSLAAYGATADDGIQISQSGAHREISYYTGNIRLTKGWGNDWYYTVHSHYGFDTQLIVSGSVALQGVLSRMKFETGSPVTFRNGFVTFRMA